MWREGRTFQTKNPIAKTLRPETPGVQGRARSEVNLWEEMSEDSSRQRSNGEYRAL
jgi:hypothetical protein